ncbi:UDP-N-acetylmuramate dehydrogenase [Xenorhabdus nematophila]|uniref:UDP-N-acetylenolpyruvoylglucosamine reductase n=1 Tax=Xenorhabdus nematophila (strain ATCC 19061 / DSM 3370 / CCUG 14189 / LMG 1036 / NCIMB 9965 / AN6) TaxID=406817 RepID=D3VHN1_XENNA|nr:UDP-N-acetylmuramate dehydrogenase [Xenorhabdus nematophila]CEE93494.1 UDP-N-acetylenolpyruvoylglucosamine reductase, FAD-binding [Xenorhabdus nematophila str. Anatoliense]CBJ88370.1 UDP-N-acetylenolpyruvoylglucosamine reductase, FAD-binding [Xenorhabdus nematophila ATCC 19061]CCW30659.1 UDP-N-acetylenolpyruvoylglucosamine reductase [Xenorhabdus nematophila F1]CEE95623.1 UDP-N-acetylenolpyruvoylglucosamine reductase, FAD-binding [Xenorhabdus nematophila str. Anatoliense]CEK21288.1 UDP-N-ace
MFVYQSTQLKAFNTFSILAYADHIVAATTIESLLSLWQEAQRKNHPILLLGGGSNVLFTENFKGTVILNRILGINIQESDTAWHIHVGAGENWHNLIISLLNQQIYGLENLALIPGNVGSAPIQNIGAYGIEFKHVCEYVDFIELESGNSIRLMTDECQFAYRDSIFKHQYKDGYAITAVGLCLNKAWEPILTYGSLTQLSRKDVTPEQIFHSVCEMRQSKLPDPAITGNAGSFFKNPIISPELAQKIKSQYPSCPQYHHNENSVKIAAGWLIDQCHLKGYSIGGAAVHTQQALVLVNKGNATGKDVIALAAYVRSKVVEKFNIFLEPEVRFIGSQGEIDAVECIS